MESRAENNARIGRLYYKVLTNAAGAPNGMAYWEEMSPLEKYCHAAVGVVFARLLADEGFVAAAKDFGLEGGFGEGDCADLMAHLEEASRSERAEFASRMRSVLGGGGDGTSSADDA